jgi:phage shock protein PspC (stress-responsive transcriptional regulator)/gas vesicle protein
MNEVTRIHLGRITYEIDVEAKKGLEKYIAAIKKSLGDAEIMDDIESRMTEILAERGVDRDGVITSGDVAAIRAQLGEPRDFAGDDAGGEDNEDWRDNSSTRGQDDRGGAYKKYYRDDQNGILGGVAAGLSAYTGWDLTLVRVAFVIFALISLGWAVLAYVIIWIVAPAARTASERLEMRGEPVTLESLRSSDFGQRAEKNAKAFAADVKDKVADIKSKAKQSKNEIRDDVRDVKNQAKTYAAGIKDEIKEEIRNQREEQREERREYREESRAAAVSPVAAIFGVIFYCIGFIVLVSTFAVGAVATVILVQNQFAGEVWLWLALSASFISGLTAVGFLITAGQALMDRRKRRDVAGNIAGTIGGTIMFGFMATMFTGLWLWTVPRDYQLPDNLTHHIRRLTDEEVCRVKVNWSGVEILRRCD